MTYRDALRRSAATFVFAFTGSLAGLNLLDAEVGVWKTAAATGIGALLNLAYRVSEAWLRENDGEVDDAGP